MKNTSKTRGKEAHSRRFAGRQQARYKAETGFAVGFSDRFHQGRDEGTYLRLSGKLSINPIL
jgi:hypothetical protein